ncbi:isoprenoid synthase domain-containing protein [Suillus ampliporus]|nr:isoprenoid synthase domain-containing protein [Suillus ampliporus]
MTSAATYTTADSERKPLGFILPDLTSYCQYPLRQNFHCYLVSWASELWLLNEVHLVEPKITTFMSLHAGEFAAACYPDANAFHLRVYSDFTNWLFKIDDWMDEFDVDDTWRMREYYMSIFCDPISFHTEKLGKMCQSYFRETAGPGCTERFIHTMGLFFIAAIKQADDRAKGLIPDLGPYIAVRQDTSGCKPIFSFIEYANRIDLPNEVTSHPVIMTMEEATNDLITWSNLYKGAIQRFEDSRAILPSWGEELDKQVAIYVEGLQNWIVSALHWPFGSTRYFGKDRCAVKRDRIIKLLPKRPL